MNEESSAPPPVPDRETAPRPPRSSQGAPIPPREARDDPLLDCLVILTAMFERPRSADALCAGLPLHGERMTPDLFIRAAARADLSARLVRRRIGDIPDFALPCVLLLEQGGACILVRRLAGERASVILPETGRGAAEIEEEDLARRYTGLALLAKPGYRFDSRSEATEIRRPRRWFWGTLACFWRIYAQVAVAAVLINSLAVATPLFIMNVYDRVVPIKAEVTLWVLAAGVLTVFVFDFVLRSLRAHFLETAGRSADVILASTIFEQVLGIRLAERPTSAGAFANQLREFESLREFFTSSTLTTLVDVPFILLFIAVVFAIGGPIAFVPLIAVPLVVGAGLLLQIPLTRVVAANARETAQKHALLVETIVGLETIKSLGAEGRMQRNWERFVKVTARSAKRARLLSQTGMFVTTFVTQATTVAVVVAGVLLMIHGGAEYGITVGVVVAATILTGRAMAPLGQVASILVRFNQAMTALRTLDALMKKPVERPRDRAFVHRPVLRGDIRFREVSFTYPGQPAKALDRVSLHIRAGEKVGIVGKIGSGKSTLGKLILGLYTPDEGAILVDGTDVAQIDPADLRHNIGYVPQDIFLFYGTVRENMVLGAPHADDATVLWAARFAGVEDFVRRHPMGFDLQVGERGEALSGGQRQAIAVARALIDAPPILILDEPTGAMDKGSEDRLITRLRDFARERTLVMVTHRASLLSLVDRLIVMDGGRVVADGAKEEVLERLAHGRIRSAA